METMERATESIGTPITFLEKFKVTMKKQGRSRIWLAKFLGISRQSLYIKIKYDDFSESEKDAVRKELGIQ